MRIACTNHHRQLVGGTESYLKRVIPEFVRLGYQVSLWHEGAVKPGAATIDAPEMFQVGAGAPALLAAWKPDLIYNNGLMGMEWEAALGRIAPVVHFAHNYYGTCISGAKTLQWPAPQPCERCLGPGCLVQYLPRQCGGRNPLTMWHDYQLQSQRLQHLRNCAAIVTASRHMEQEYRRHGLERIHHAPLFVDAVACPPDTDRFRVLFCGRMMRLKGGELLLDAIPAVERLLNRPVEFYFAGDGPERAAWQNRATKAKFLGWISQTEIRALKAGVLVMPSLWPEPFGLAGLELGIPVAAFPVGGIPDWLREGVNGHLAKDLTPLSLARAIVACVAEDAHFEELRAGAVRVAAEFSLERHLQALVPIFEGTAR